MRDLPFEAELDAAFCFGNSFGYLDEPGTPCSSSASRGL